MKYRKKPVVIEARLLTVSNIKSIEEWCGGQIKGTALPADQQGISIYTLEGEMWAEIGDYVIKGVAGEFYPCKPAIFELTYEVAE